MTNEEKAKAIANTYPLGICYVTANIAAMEMAEWKDERVKSCFIQISKLVKDGILTKDNSEHIMVEQMIELYNYIHDNPELMKGGKK